MHVLIMASAHFIRQPERCFLSDNKRRWLPRNEWSSRIY